MRDDPSHVALEVELGERIKDRYRLVALLGSGAQAAVFRAHDDLLDRDVAVKLLHSEARHDATAHERLVREAHALALLSDTAAVALLDQAFTRDGRLCLVTELLLGRDLESTLRALESENREPTLRELFRIFPPIVETLERAHENGIVHRDVKPANVFLERTAAGSRVRVLDFGFARLARLPRVTADGTIAGSPSYIAPETWEGTPATPSADVYALGATIFRFLSGRPPFLGEGTLDIMRRTVVAPRPSLAALRRDLPADVDRWVARALAIAPKDRFPSVRALYRGLTAVLGMA